MHFKNSKSCAANIDMDHFTDIYGKMKKADRLKADKQRKRNERQANRKIDEETLKRNWAEEKQEKRRKERELDEDAFKKKRARDKQEERRKEREKDEDALRKKMAWEKQEQREKERDKSDKFSCLKNYFRSVIFGPIFICSCCHRKLFEKGVTKVTEAFKEKLAERKVLYAIAIPASQEVQVNIKLDGSTSLSGIYICHTCRRCLLGGKMPAMAVQNGLSMSPIPEGYHLTEFENNLIAKTLNFQYIYLLPKSRWAATKKRMISVPVREETVRETLSQLPRLPKDAGLLHLIPVNLKRKLEYKNIHKKEYIDPEKVMAVTKFLRDSGHPYYQFCDDLNLDTYKERCRNQDNKSYDLLFADDEVERKMANDKLATKMEIDKERQDPCGESNNFDKIGQSKNSKTDEMKRLCKEYQELYGNVDINWDEIDEDKILKVIETISRNPIVHFMKDFNLGKFKEMYKTLNIYTINNEEVDDIEKENNTSYDDEEMYNTLNVDTIEDEEVIDIEKEKDTSYDDDENWTDVDSEDERDDETEGTYEDIIVQCHFKGDKKMLEIYRENSDIYTATLSEKSWDKLRASAYENDEDKIQENIFRIFSKIYYEAKVRIKKVEKSNEKPTLIHMDNDKGLLTMMIYMRLL